MDTAASARFHTIDSGLQRYLPEALHHALRLDRCIDHLDALLRAVSTYLPRYLVEEQLADPRPGQVSGQFRQATLMFADISGFTAMSEQLSRQGQQGAEAIANIVGDYFTTMLDIAAGQGGDLLKFGGDALLIAFFRTGSPSEDCQSSDALAACQAAVRMQQAMDRFGAIEALGETFRLQMTVGLGSGSLFTANLGAGNRMEHTVMGEALANMAHAEDQARGGEICIDQATYQAAAAHIAVGKARRGRTSSSRCYPLSRVDGIAPPHPLPAGTLPSQGTLSRTVEGVRDGAACLDALVPYLPPGLLDLLCFDPRRMASRERGEFRPVTVLFANFYGTEEIIRQLGPDRAGEITAILNAHFSQMQEIIGRYDGALAKVDSYVVGHRIMALFGAPRAHVDDPERAVRAACEMQAAMSAFRELETSAGVYALKQRIGINTGRVFAGNVGSDLRQEYSVMGDEVNLTARLMSVAREGQVLISQRTAAQAGARFDLEEQAPVRVKGKSHPVPNYLVRGPASRVSLLVPSRGARTQDAESTHRAPLIGRDEEWRTLWLVAQQAREGACRLLDIHGEMGMGKSRLVEELIDRWTEQGGATYFSACVSYGRHTPYAPWIAVLNELFSLRESDSPETKRRKLTDRLAAIPPRWAGGLYPVDWAPLVAQVLGVPMPEGELIQSLEPRLRQQNLQRIVHGLLCSESDRRPVLLVIDDIQWIDRVSLDLLNHVIDQVGQEGEHPLLICVVHRSEDEDSAAVSSVDVSSAAVPSAVSQPHRLLPGCTTLELGALSEAGSLALLESQLPLVRPALGEDATGNAHWQRLTELILKNAQGNPLYIVEMAHALTENYMQYDVESQAYRTRDGLDRVQVPDTVSRVILSRLDRLDEGSRTMLKVASAIGREFQRWLLQSVYPYSMSEPDLESNLLDLCAKDILARSQVMYLFRHVMTREVAYESLLYAERRDLHRRIARSIEAQAVDHIHPPDATHPEAEALAQHYTLAQEWPQALRYQLQAGRRARAIYANEDAIHRFREALRVAEHVPGSQAQQLAAHEQLGEVLTIVGQYDEALTHNDRAIALAMEQSASAEAAARRLAELFRQAAFIYEKKSEYETAFEWLQGGLIALEGMEAIEAARIHLMGAGIYHRRGDNAQALQWCQHSLDIAARRRTGVGGERDPASANVLAHAYYLQGAIYLRYGDYAQAIAVCQKSLELYQQQGNLPEAGSAHNNLATATFYQGNWVQATEHYTQALDIKTQIGDVHECAMIANNLGGVYLNRGQLDEAEALYRQSLQTWQTLGSTYGEAFLQMNLAAMALKRQRWAQAISLLDQSRERVDQIGARGLLPEVYRYLAEAHLGLGRAPLDAGQLDQARRWAEQSLAIAQEHEMKLEEGDTRRVLGQIHSLLGDHRAAERELEASLALLESLDSQYPVGQTVHQLAQLHASRGRASRARAEFDRAISIFEQLDAQLDLQQALAQRDALAS